MHHDLNGNGRAMHDELVDEPVRHGRERGVS
jgi:hypothetical protein